MSAPDESDDCFVSPMFTGPRLVLPFVAPVSQHCDDSWVSLVYPGLRVNDRLMCILLVGESPSAIRILGPSVAVGHGRTRPKRRGENGPEPKSLHILTSQTLQTALGTSKP